VASKSTYLDFAWPPNRRIWISLGRLAAYTYDGKLFGGSGGSGGQLLGGPDGLSISQSKHRESRTRSEPMGKWERVGTYGSGTRSEPMGVEPGRTYWSKVQLCRSKSFCILGA
jgi:hypothetical protein